MLSTRPKTGGTRRLAFAAVAATALAGLPSVASANPVAEQVGPGELVLYSQFGGTPRASVRPDGGGTSVRLQAGAGADVTQVTFSYVRDGKETTIARVGRNDDGAFAHDWSPGSALTGAVLTLRATATAGTGEAARTLIVERPGVEIRGAGAPDHAVDLASGSTLPYFEQPYGGDQGRTLVAVEGTTSAKGGNVTVSHLGGDGSRVGATPLPVTAAAGAAYGRFEGLLDLGDYAFDTAEKPTDQVVIAAIRDTDDVEAYTLEKQQIRTVQAKADRTMVKADPNPFGGATAKVTVTVLDQKNRPVPGAEVRASTGGDLRYTDADGVVTFDQGAAQAYYYANTDGGDDYDPAVDVRSSTVDVTFYEPAPTRFEASSADGPAFDRNEAATGDITLQVKDQAGDDLAAMFRRVQYYWIIRPFSGDPAQVRYPGTGTDSAFTGFSGSADIPFPTDRPSGVYELWASLDADLLGRGRIARERVLTVRAGHAEVTWSAPGQAMAGTAARVGGRLALEDGTGLPGRLVDLAWTRGEEADPAGAGDSGLVGTNGRLGTTLQVKTDTAGGFAATVQDPTEAPQPTEAGGQLVATTPATPGIGSARATSAPHHLDFVGAVPVGSATIAPETALSAQGKTPGRPVRSTVTVRGLAGEPLANQKVTLTTDRGFFTPYAASMAGLTPAATPTTGAPVGEWKDEGKTVEVTTDASGVARFALAIARDAGFDDDGRADATVTAKVTGSAGTSATDTEVVDWTTANPLNGGKVRVEPAPAALQESGVLPKAPTTDRVLLDVVAEDQFGNPVAGETVRLAEGAAGATIDRQSVTTDLVADGDVVATATAGGAQTVTATWQTETHRWSTPTTQAPAGTETLTGSDTIEW